MLAIILQSKLSGDTMPGMSHSAKVSMVLRVDERTIPVAQLGPDFLIVGETRDCLAASGTLDLTIDGARSSYRVDLPQGISMARIKQPAKFSPV